MGQKKGRAAYIIHARASVTLEVEDRNPVSGVSRPMVNSR